MQVLKKDQKKVLGLKRWQKVQNENSKLKTVVFFAEVFFLGTRNYLRVWKVN